MSRKLGPNLQNGHRVQQIVASEQTMALDIG